MAEIESLDELNGVRITREQLNGLLNRIDINITNLLTGNGPMTALDIKEGDHESRPTVLLARFKDMREMYQRLLDQMDENENAIIVSRWDDPDLSYPNSGNL